MSSATLQPMVKGFFDPATWTVSYVVYACSGSPALIIDPVLDYDHKAGRTSTHSADQIIAFVRGNGLHVEWILETHAHADHLTAAPYLRTQLGGRIAIGEHIRQVQRAFRDIFNLGDSLATDGSQFDMLLSDGQEIACGDLRLKAIATPGHTPACMAFETGDAIFVGDTLFMPDVGTARCDFPGGDARALYRSVRSILNRPPQTRLFMCHDYPPDARPIAFETTVAAQRAGNIHIRDGITEDAFVVMRQTRDATLAMPVLILPAIQVNVRAGHMPAPEANGISYLKIPVNAL